MNGPVTELTGAQWRASCAAYRVGRPELEAQVGPEFLLGFHGGRPEALEAYREVPALPLGAFAACMGVPKTAVRYYTRLGLTSYFKVGRRHLYPTFACMELARVTQLRRLGVGMAELKAQLAREQAHAVANLEALRAAGVDMAAQVPPAREELSRAMQTPPVQAAVQALTAERKDFYARRRAELEAQRDEAERRLHDLRALEPGDPDASP